MITGIYSSVVMVSGWQRWLLKLQDQVSGQEVGVASSVTEMVHSLLLSVLCQCFMCEQDGWRVWVDTVATLHTHVSHIQPSHVIC